MAKLTKKQRQYWIWEQHQNSLLSPPIAVDQSSSVLPSYLRRRLIRRQDLTIASNYRVLVEAESMPQGANAYPDRYMRKQYRQYQVQPNNFLSLFIVPIGVTVFPDYLPRKSRRQDYMVMVNNGLLSPVVEDSIGSTLHGEVVRRKARQFWFEQLNNNVLTPAIEDLPIGDTLYIDIVRQIKTRQHWFEQPNNNLLNPFVEDLPIGSQLYIDIIRQVQPRQYHFEQPNNNLLNPFIESIPPGVQLYPSYINRIKSNQDYFLRSNNSLLNPEPLPIGYVYFPNIVLPKKFHQYHIQQVNNNLLNPFIEPMPQGVMSFIDIIYRKTQPRGFIHEPDILFNPGETTLASILMPSYLRRRVISRQYLADPVIFIPITEEPFIQTQFRLSNPVTRRPRLHQYLTYRHAQELEQDPIRAYLDLPVRQIRRLLQYQLNRYTQEIPVEPLPVGTIYLPDYLPHYRVRPAHVWWYGRNFLNLLPPDIIDYIFNAGVTIEERPSGIAVIRENLSGLASLDQPPIGEARREPKRD